MDTLTTEGMVLHHQCDACGNLKLPALLDAMQDAAAQHASRLRFGMEEMSAAGLIWVLARLKLRVLQTPRLGDAWRLLTYPRGFDRLLARRQYTLSVGETVQVICGSEWLLIHPETGRPANPFKVLGEAMPLNEELELFFPALEKLPPASGEACGSAVVGMGDVDLNRHLNNAVYGRWVVDMLGKLKPHCVPSIREFQINYLHPGVSGDEIGFSGSWGDDGAFQCSGVWQSSGIAAFQAVGLADALPL